MCTLYNIITKSFNESLLRIKLIPCLWQLIINKTFFLNSTSSQIEKQKAIGIYYTTYLQIKRIVLIEISKQF